MINFITQRSADYINKIFDSYVDPSKKNQTKRFHPSPENFSMVLDELGINTRDVNLLRIEETANIIAVPPHADRPKGFITTLVPLKFISPVSTILFDSFYTGNNSNGYKYRPSNKKYYQNEWLSSDPNNITNISNEEFNQEHYKKYLSYMPKKDLHGIKIQKTIEWIKNSIIKFPSHQLHSGSIFSNNKRWLLVVSATIE